MAYFCHHFRGVAQPGSALRSGRRGRWFESSRPDKLVRPWPSVRAYYFNFFANSYGHQTNSAK
jgi:hypothetical protein